MTTTLARVSWTEQAACRTENPALFFPDEQSRPTGADVRRAKAICVPCPVWRECLTYALDTRVSVGIWGGLDPDERAARPRPD